MMEDKSVRLTSAEVAVLDSLVAVAQRVGYSLDLSDDEDCDNHACAEHRDEFMGRWQDTRHDGVILAYVEHDILPRLRQLLSEVEQPTTLRRLLELRGKATRRS
jgi:hypothetical protein